MKKQAGFRKWFFRLMAVAVLFLLFHWLIGFDKAAERWEFWRKGQGSVNVVESFYEAASEKDTATLFALISERIIEQEASIGMDTSLSGVFPVSENIARLEGRKKIMAALQWGVEGFGPDEKEIKISGRKMRGDTAVVQVSPVSGTMDKKLIQFFLVKENGRWKITFPQKPVIVHF